MKTPKDQDDRPLLTSTEAAQAIGIAPETLCRWRGEGRGPAFIQSGRYVRYRAAAIDEWLCGNGDRDQAA